jgi:hypothetical protein
MQRIKYVKGKPYFLYDVYSEWSEAIKIAFHYKKKNKSRYFISKEEVGILFPQEKYGLYLDKVLSGRSLGL